MLLTIAQLCQSSIGRGMFGPFYLTRKCNRAMTTSAIQRVAPPPTFWGFFWIQNSPDNARARYVGNTFNRVTVLFFYFTRNSLCFGNRPIVEWCFSCVQRHSRHEPLPSIVPFLTSGRVGRERGIRSGLVSTVSIVRTVLSSLKTCVWLLSVSCTRSLTLFLSLFIFLFLLPVLCSSCSNFNILLAVCQSGCSSLLIVFVVAVTTSKYGNTRQ